MAIAESHNDLKNRMLLIMKIKTAMRSSKIEFHHSGLRSPLPSSRIGHISTGLMLVPSYLLV